MIRTNNQDFSLICVQLQDMGSHPVINGGKAAVQRIQIVTIFRTKQDVQLGVICITVVGHRGEMSNNMTKGQ